jgi:hypothetical protein
MAIAIFSTAVILVDAFFTMPSQFSGFVSQYQKLDVVIQATALGLAFITLFFYHGRHVQRRTPGQWYLSAWLIIIMTIVTILGLIPPITKHALYQRFYNDIYIPSNIALYGIMACFIASATYRAFRARTMDGAMCLIAAGAVLVGMNTPLGDMISPIIPQIASWFVLVPQMGGGRTLIFLTAIGMIGLTLRLVTGRIREIV